jgi:hypothetical protein
VNEVQFSLDLGLVGTWDLRQVCVVGRMEIQTNIGTKSKSFGDGGSYISFPEG